MTWTPKARRFWPLFALVLLTDCATKRAAELHLIPAQVPHELFGEIVRLTLAYNPGAAMSLSLLAVGALLLMGHLYRRTEPGDRQAAGGLALIAAGAVGNLIDRLRSDRGVVDFIDIGIGGWRFWTFNIADMAILFGAIVLVLALQRMDTAEGGQLSRS